jgi:hypothetical protein
MERETLGGIMQVGMFIAALVAVWRYSENGVQVTIGVFILLMVTAAIQDQKDTSIGSHTYWEETTPRR